MTMSSLLESFDTVSHSEQLVLRLETATAELSKKQGLKDEKAWLETAMQRVVNAREGTGDLLNRVLRLPELEPVREEHARVLQGAVVDAVERLHAGITFAGGSRAPLIEALYGKLKLPVLRRCDRADFEKFCTDFEKRLNTGYAKRMFADPSFQLVVPVLSQLHQAISTWRSVFSDQPLSDADAQALRDELDAVSRRLELPCRQARLLAEAALAPLKDVFESSGLAQKPKRRAKSMLVETGDEESSLEDEAVDPSVPSAEELAELGAVEPEPTPPEEAPIPEIQKSKRPRKQNKMPELSSDTN